MDASVATGCRCLSVAKEHKGDRLVVLEDGRITSVMSLPPRVSVEGKDADLLQDKCCENSGRAQAQVHRGEITEDVLLDLCMEEACCILPMATWDVASFPLVDPFHGQDHEHRDGCGHSQVVHGDHNDWLIPQNDGSFLLSHADTTGQFHEHGRLVKVGELESRPKQRKSLFTLKSPIKDGYVPVSQEEESWQVVANAVEKNAPQYAGKVLHTGRQEDMDMVIVAMPEDVKPVLAKTVLNVMAMCCPAEVQLIRKILEPLPGVADVSVNFTARTATVLHDVNLISEGRVLKLLNHARLEASIKQRGEASTTSKWPSPWTMASGFLLVISLFHYIFSPLRWVALGCIAIGLPPMLLRSMVALRSYHLDINVLMAISVVGAAALEDFVEAGTITFLFSVAGWLESLSGEKARKAIGSILSLAPQTAVLSDSGLQVKVEEVKVGTSIAVKAGELIPLDGVVISGKSCVDESSLTGESLPVEKEADSTVWAGTVNLSGYISMKTTALAEDSTVARMIRLVEEAQTARSRTEQYVNKFAKYFTPAVVLAAVLVAVIPAAIGVQNMRHWLYLALVILVGACPCALVVSTPVTTTCALARAAKAGLVIKGGAYLEALGGMKYIAIDKTGTLTEGHFHVLGVESVDKQADTDHILYWMASVENKASHPMAAAIVAHARMHKVQISDDVVDFQLLEGEGVSAVVDGRLVSIGNARLASRLGWLEDTLAVPILDEWKKEEATIGWIGVDKKLVGLFCVGDEVRPEAAEAVSDLKRAGISVAILTGDSEAAAQAVRKKIGEVDVHAQLLPGDKVRLVKEMMTKGMTGMLGDGINDAPALATADIGIAMGVAGSAVAMETAHVSLMTNDLTKITGAVLLGQACRRKIQLNIFLALFTKAVVLGLALGGYAALWAAVVADVGTCLLVTFNSMRLLKWNKFQRRKDDKGGSRSMTNFFRKAKLQRLGADCNEACCTPGLERSSDDRLPCCTYDEESGTVVCQPSGPSGDTMRRRIGVKEACASSKHLLPISSLGAERVKTTCCSESFAATPPLAANVSACSKQCCGSASAAPMPEPVLKPTTCAKKCCAVQKPVGDTATPVSQTEKSCSKGCCGEKKPAPVAAGANHCSANVSACSKQCCGPASDPPIPVLKSTTCVKKCCAEQKPVGDIPPLVPQTEKSCSKGCCGEKKPAPVAESANHSSANVGACSKQCCGPASAPPTPVPVLKSTACVKKCCAEQKPVGDSAPPPVPQTEKSCSKACCGEKKPAPMAEGTDPCSKKCCAEKPVLVADSGKACAKQCCDEKKPVEVATGRPTKHSGIKLVEGGKVSSKTCCGDKKPVLVAENVKSCCEENEPVVVGTACHTKHTGTKTVEGGKKKCCGHK